MGTLLLKEEPALSAFSAKAPCPISLRPGPLDGFVSPTEYEGKL